MRIALLHTSDVHVPTFDAIFAAEAEGARLTHEVDPGLLARACEDGLGAVRLKVLDRLADLAGRFDAVLCTCSTLGPLVDEAGAAHVVRIDRPLMEAACAWSGRVIVAICLESTRAPSLSLLEDCAQRSGRTVEPDVVFCEGAWKRFEAQDKHGYSLKISQAIRGAMSGSPVACVVLAQASMRVAEADLSNLGVPVLSAPVLAVRSCLAVARPT